MIATALLVGTLSVLASPSWGALDGTAQTLARGEWAVRLPTGRTSVGVAHSTEAWIVPFDLWILGSRIGVECTVGRWDRVTLSVAPSVGEKWSLGRTWLSLEVVATAMFANHQLSLAIAPDVGLLRQARLGANSERHTWTADRVHLPVRVIYDWLWSNSIVRASAQLMLYDEGEMATYGVLAASWIHRWRWLNVEVGAAMLVGTPSEHTFLGRYQHVLVMGYPKLDLWVQF